MADPGHDGYTPRPEPTNPADSPFPWRERVLSDDDLAFFDDNGYVIVHNAITDAAADATVNEMWNFLGMDRCAAFFFFFWVEPTVPSLVPLIPLPVCV